MAEPDFTVQDLARIILDVAIKKEIAEPFPYVGLVAVRAAFKGFTVIPPERRKDMHLPFSDAEWKILDDTDGLWKEIQIQAGLEPNRSFRIQIDRDRILELIKHEWDLHPTSTVNKTLCYGSAMNALGMHKR